MFATMTIDRAFRSRRLRPLGLMFAAVLAAPAWAADGAVSGGVKAPEGSPLAAVLVQLEGGGSTRRMRTAANGEFRFSGVTEGHYVLVAEHPGFAKHRAAVEVRSGETTSVEVSLDLPRLSEAVVVSATRAEQKVVDSPVHVSVLEATEARQSAALTVDDMLKQIPSFSLFRRSSSLVSNPTTQGVSLRGIGASGASRTLVLVDGVPLNDAFGNWVTWSKIAPSQIDSIEVSPSGLSTLYGSSAMAGVIQVFTKHPQGRAIDLDLRGGGKGTWNADLNANDRRGAWAAAVGGRFFETDGYTLVRADQRGAVDVNAASRNRAGSWRLSYSPSPNLEIFQTGRVFRENRDNGTPLTMNATRETYLAAGLRSGASTSLFQANAFTRFGHFDSTFSAIGANRATESLTLAQNVDFTEVGGNAQWLRSAGRHLFTIGADARSVNGENDEDVFVNGTNLRDRLIPGDQAYGGVFAQDLIRPTSRLEIMLGARLDYWQNHNASKTEILNATGATTVTPFPNKSKTTATPRVGARFAVTRDFALRGAFYRGFRAPSLNELYRPFRVGNVQTEENPNLGPEKLAGGELGFTHVVGPRFFWQATGFWNRLEDPISNTTISVTPALITRRRENLGRARISGIEAEAEYRVGAHARVRGAYHLSDAIVQSFTADPRLEGKLIAQVPKHRASLRVEYLASAGLTFAVQNRYESVRYDDDQNLLPLGSFFVMDARVEKRVGAGAVFAAVENLFDRDYAVQATPVQLLGTPRLFTAGIRLDWRGR